MNIYPHEVLFNILNRCLAVLVVIAIIAILAAMFLPALG